MGCRNYKDAAECENKIPCEGCNHFVRCPVTNYHYTGWCDECPSTFRACKRNPFWGAVPEKPEGPGSGNGLDTDKNTLKSEEAAPESPDVSARKASLRAKYPTPESLMDAYWVSRESFPGWVMNTAGEMRRCGCGRTVASGGHYALIPRTDFTKPENIRCAECFYREIIGEPTTADTCQTDSEEPRGMAVPDETVKSPLPNVGDLPEGPTKSNIDAVNHPPHYTSHPSGVECITVTEHMLFNLGSAIKYIWRADLKSDAIEDLKKARWYLNREIARREKE